MSDATGKIMNGGDIEERGAIAGEKQGTARTSETAMTRKLLFVPEVLAVPDVPFLKSNY
jgi:hypothetical protein